MTRTDLHRLVDELPDDAIDGITALLHKIVLRQIDPDQLWFWTAEWQQHEREVDERLARGERGTVQHSNEEFLAALDAQIQQLDA